MADYQLAGAGMVFRRSDSQLIVANGDDPSYQAYLAWLADGNTADPDPATLLPHDNTFADDPFLPLKSE